MRITNTMLVNNMINYIGNNLGRMEKFQSQLATGKKIQVPSDDPVVAARALKLRTDVSEVEQYQRNVKDATSWLEVTESAVSKIGDVLQRARELAVQGSSGTLTDEDTNKIKQEITQLKTQIIHLANTTYAGRYVFSGYSTDKKLMNDDESSPDFGKFSIDVANSESIKFEIGIGDDININVPGGDLFNVPSADADGTPVAQTPSMIKHFEDFETFLATGNHSGVNSVLTSLDADINNLLRVRADIGARMNRLELTENRLESDYINFTKLMSENEDVDEAETIMNLQNEENVYRASLAGGAKIIQPTLVDFLR